MLAILRMNHLTKDTSLMSDSPITATTIVPTTNISTNNNSNENSTSTNLDESTSSHLHPDKIFLSNGNLGPEPTTPCVLNTPNTCTKNATFFYDIPTNLHPSTLNGNVQ